MVGKPAVEEKKTNCTQARAPPPALPAEEKKVNSAAPADKQMNRAWSVPLMDICRFDTPLVKRIPNSQRSAFATIGADFLIL